MTSGEDLPHLQSVVELESLAACWLTMARGETRDEIETAALSGLIGLTDVRIAYTARRDSGVWTISNAVGLRGDIAGVAVPEGLVPYAELLRAGDTICYESPSEMGPDLAPSMAAVGLASIYGVPVMRAGECIGALAVGAPHPTHFTARDRALARLFTAHLGVLQVRRDLVQSLETLSESAPAIVFRTDPSGWINWYNRRWYSFTGQTREEALGWGWQTALYPDDFQRVIVEWPKSLATGQPIEVEFRLRRYDGVYHWHLSRTEPVRDDNGKILSWYGTIADIEAQKQALERTRRVADSLQAAFLPQTLPQRPNLRLDAKYVSAEKDALVGGDWYDAFELPDGRLAFSIGDVAGHGLAASVAVGNLRQTIFALALQNEDPAEILAGVNRVLRLQEPGTFATVLVGLIDRDGATLRYATAGHPPPAVAYRPDEPAIILASDGPPLGVVDELALTTHVVRIVKDMVVALYTDGVTESDHDALSGERRLRDIVPLLVGKTSLAQPAGTLYELLLRGVNHQDDVAILVLQFSTIDDLVPTDPVPTTKQWRFHASDVKAAHVARSEVSAYFRRVCDDTEAIFDGELIIGELLANTVTHAPGLVHLIIEWTGDNFIVIVRDSGPGMDVVRRTLPDDPLAEGSRGLYLVHALSAEVMVTSSPSGGTELRVLVPLKHAQQ